MRMSCMEYWQINEPGSLPCSRFEPWAQDLSVRRLSAGRRQAARALPGPAGGPGPGGQLGGPMGIRPIRKGPPSRQPATAARADLARRASSSGSPLRLAHGHHDTVTPSHGHCQRHLHSESLSESCAVSVAASGGVSHGGSSRCCLRLRLALGAAMANGRGAPRAHAAGGAAIGPDSAAARPTQVAVCGHWQNEFAADPGAFGALPVAAAALFNRGPVTARVRLCRRTVPVTGLGNAH